MNLNKSGNSQYIGTTEAAKLLGVTRVTIFNRIKRGQIEAIKIGRNYVIDKRTLGDIFQEMTEADRKKVDVAVDKVFKEYGNVLKRLGTE